MSTASYHRWLIPRNQTRARCVGLERTTAASSRGLCGPPTVGAKDSLIGLLERRAHRRQRISALSPAAFVRERLPYHLESRPTQAFGEGPPVLHYVDRE